MGAVLGTGSPSDGRRICLEGQRGGPRVTRRPRVWAAPEKMQDRASSGAGRVPQTAMCPGRGALGDSGVMGCGWSEAQEKIMGREY